MSSRPSGSNSPAARRSVTFLLVALLHLGAVFGPMLFLDILSRKTPKDNAFRVKIGAAELSQGPDVGMPERKKPVPPVPPPPAPEPKIPPAPAPEPVIPRVPPEPKVPLVKPKPKNKPKPKKQLKPKVKPKQKPKVTPRKKPTEPKLHPRKKPLRPQKKQTPPKKKIRPRPKNKMDDVFQDNTPVNINPKVPTGSRNRSQKYAPKADNKAPGGGRKTDEAAFQRYGKNVENYIYSRWTEPPRTLLRGEFPETVVEITIEANGRVSAAKVIQASNNQAMEESVQVLLSQLDLLPRPPDGRITFQITLKTR